MGIGIFGPGILIGTRTDVTPSTPINIGYAQEFSFVAKGATKKAYGQNQLPLFAARATIDTSGKFKAATLSGIAMNNLFWGQSFTGGNIAWNIAEAHSVPATGPYTVTVNNAATFDADLGVTYAASGLPLQRVSAVAAAGQYSVNSATGVYTFYSADEGAAVTITYTNTQSGTGQSITVVSKPIGFTPTFQLDYYTNLNQPSSAPFVLRLYAGIAADMTWQFKIDDYMYPEWSIDLFTNAAGQLYTGYFPNIS